MATCCSCPQSTENQHKRVLINIAWGTRENPLNWTFAVKISWPLWTSNFLLFLSRDHCFRSVCIYRATHWGQTLFYVEKEPEVKQDTVISGKLSLRPNQQKPR